MQRSYLKKVERSTTRVLARTLQAIGSGKSVPLENRVKK
jgi:hypothetical protein